MHLPHHPATGFGDLIPGSFNIPQNPILDAGTPLVPSLSAATGQVTYRPHMGELIAAQYTVPQNPLLSAILAANPSQPDAKAGSQAVAALHGLSCGNCGAGYGGCGCGGGDADWHSNSTGLMGVLSDHDDDGEGVRHAYAYGHVVPRHDIKNDWSTYWAIPHPHSVGGMSGMGDTSFSDMVSSPSMSSITDWLTSPSPISSIPNWMLYGAGGVIAWIVLAPGGSEYRSQAKALRSKYRGYRRFGRGLSES
jgi:hypothetical protein